MTTGQLCSAHVYRGHFSSGSCTRKAVVVRDGKPYCKQHDPVLVEKRRADRYEEWRTTCDYREDHYANKCGKPAINSRCADHTDEALAARKRLNEAAPDLVAALQAYVTWLDEDNAPDPEPMIRAALLKATGGQV